MSTETIIIIAILTPRKDQFSQVLKLLEEVLIPAVKAREPECLEFSIHREVNPTTDFEEILTYEKFHNPAAVEFHQNNAAFLEVVKTLKDKDLLEKPLYSRTVKVVGGFTRS
ncbi:hypothetical protein F5884DRAFT_854723 [Xylogone sp. PMI_703]|nr:hypothetical protein F5884DRAFT_854723 [Xylogone sp. PMI_703]